METLKYIYSLVAEWLKFAEAKNLALIIFNSGVMVAMLGALTTISTLPTYYKIALILLFISNLFSLFFIFYGVVPRLHKHLSFHKHYSTEHNLFFYGGFSKL